MNCQEAIERLPWWLNGSLESVERREVGEHLEGCAACREALGETRLAWEIYGQHIPTEALVAIAGGEPPVGDSALYDRHLASCPQCAAELEMARASFLLGEHADVAVMPLRDSASVRRSRPERGWRTAALAAGLTSLVAIGGWVQQVQQTARLGSQNTAGSVAQREPGPAMPATGQAVSARAIEIPPTAVERGGASRVKIPAGTGQVVLLLSPVPKDTAETHSFSLLDASGAVRASSAIELSSPLDVFTVILDHKQLPRGDYTLEIYGGKGSSRTRLESIRVTVD